ncbi:MAG: serine/threonine protein kinase [Candidatus Aminicenantes bacterium]|nr:serine/threonine protein kinase [Candidatus Aminicenantes bacterium]
MNTDKQKTVVNSWNEWDPLKHVIVGKADGTVVQAPEPAIERNWPKQSFPLGTFGLLPKEMEEKANEQLDNLVHILESRGIRVDRPTPMDFNQVVQTPDWRQDTLFGCAAPRDLLLTVGNEILEATMSQRSRWYEYLCFRPLLEQYFKEDPHFRWEAAPKPRLTDDTYKKDYWRKWEIKSDEEVDRAVQNRDWVLTEKEPCFDAADIGRAGKDLFVYNSSVTNKSGLDWLRRHFSNHRIHAIWFYETNPIHIDATFVLVRPGLAVKNRKRDPLAPNMLDFFKKNDWEVVDCAEPALDDYPPLSFCSPWLSMNTLTLDSKTVCVDAQEVKQMELLDKLGLEVIPVPFGAVSAFGGGLHCCTADVYREGDCRDYFPKQIPNF